MLDEFLASNPSLFQISNVPRYRSTKQVNIKLLAARVCRVVYSSFVFSRDPRTQISILLYIYASGKREMVLGKMIRFSSSRDRFVETATHSSPFSRNLFLSPFLSPARFLVRRVTRPFQHASTYYPPPQSHSLGARMSVCRCTLYAVAAKDVYYGSFAYILLSRFDFLRPPCFFVSLCTFITRFARLFPRETPPATRLAVCYKCSSFILFSPIDYIAPIVFAFSFFCFFFRVYRCTWHSCTCTRARYVS